MSAMGELYYGNVGELVIYNVGAFPHVDGRVYIMIGSVNRDELAGI